MYKKIVGLCICMLLLATAIPAVGVGNDFDDIPMSSVRLSGIEWEKTYGGDQADKFWSVEETDDGYVACGTTEIDNKTCPWIMKVDSTGDEEWNWTITEFYHNDTYLVIDYCWCDDIQHTTDGGYIAVLSLVTFYESVEYIFGGLIKLDADGTEEWITILADEFEWTISLEAVKEVNDGYLAVGFYGDPLRSDKDYSVCMCKTNMTGELQWYKEYIDGEGFDGARDFCTTSDGGYLIVGVTQIQLPYDYDACMIKTDSDGNEEWNATFGDFDTDEFVGCYQTTDDEYIVGGYTYSYGHQPGMAPDIWLLKTDEDGNEIWNKTFGENGADFIYGFEATDDDGCLIPVVANWGSTADGWIIKTDSNGTVEWKEIYDGGGAQQFIGICSTRDGGCIASGILGPWDLWGSDALLVKYEPHPQLDFEITGGLGVKITITNNGLGDAVQVPWEITVTGGFFGLINKTINGTIDIDAGGTESLSSGLLVGLGGLEIAVTVGIKEEIVEGFQLFIFTVVP